MIEELYQRWLNHPHIDPQLKKELAGICLLYTSRCV